MTFAPEVVALIGTKTAEVALAGEDTTMGVIVVVLGMITMTVATMEPQGVIVRIMLLVVLTATPVPGMIAMGVEAMTDAAAVVVVDDMVEVTIVADTLAKNLENSTAAVVAIMMAVTIAIAAMTDMAVR